MKLKEYTIKRDLTKKKTLKSKDGSYASREEMYGVVLTFEIEDGEHLADEAVITREANTKALEALEDLQIPLGVDREDWMQTGKNDKIKKSDGYKEAK